jgi:hypothetical protein
MEAGFDWDNEDAAMESQLLASAKLYTHKTQGTPVWYTRPLAPGAPEFSVLCVRWGGLVWLLWWVVAFAVVVLVIFSIPVVPLLCPSLLLLV